MPTSRRFGASALATLRMASASVAALLFAGAASADTGPFPVCPDAAEFFCVGDIDFTSLVVTTEPFQATSDQPVTLRISAPESVAGSPCHGDFRWSRRPTVVGREIVFDVRMVEADCPTVPPDPRFKRQVTRTWDLGFLAAGVYTVRLRSDGVLPWAEARFEVHFPKPLLLLHDGLFTVYVKRDVPGGGSLLAAAVPLTDFSGYFTFFEPSNVELTVKILDGRAINGHYWVFIASMTDRPFELTVLHNQNECLTIPTDPKSVCPWRAYTATLGANRNFIDVEFPLTP